jgi:hypothetical protein
VAEHSLCLESVNYLCMSLSHVSVDHVKEGWSGMHWERLGWLVGAMHKVSCCKKPKFAPCVGRCTVPMGAPWLGSSGLWECFLDTMIVIQCKSSVLSSPALSLLFRLCQIRGSGCNSTQLHRAIIQGPSSLAATAHETSVFRGVLGGITVLNDCPSHEKFWLPAAVSRGALAPTHVI